MEFDDIGSRRDILEYLEVPLRRPWTALLPLGLCVVVAFVLSATLPKQYLSSTLILVESDRMPDSFVQKMTTESPARVLQTLKQEIMSRTRLEQIVREVDPYPEFKGKATPQDMVEKMRAVIAINVKGNDAFTIEFTHTDPKTAMEVANRLATLFIEEKSEKRSAQASGAYEFIESQLEQARESLEKQEAEIRRFKERNLGHLPEQTGANLATLQRLQTEKQAVEGNVRAATEKQELLEKNLTAGGVNTSTELNQLRSQLSTLRGRYTDEHPDVRQLENRIQRLEEKLVAGSGATPVNASDPALDTTRLELAALKSRRDELERQISSFQARVEQAPRTEQELSTLSRDYQKLRENYMSLLNRKLEAQMAEKLEQRWKGQQFRILDPAFVPDRPYYPNRQSFLLVGILAGIVLGLGAAVAVELVDRSIKNVRELETVVPFPLLATLPHVKGPNSARLAAASPITRSA